MGNVLPRKGTRSSSRVYAIGENAFGQLGTGRTSVAARKAVLLKKLRYVDVVKVVCGRQVSFAISAKGELYAWGSGFHGVLGRGGWKYKTSPSLVKAFKGKVVSDVAVGYQYAVVLADGHIYMSGADWGFRKYHLTPRLVMESATPFVRVESGMHHCVALTSTGAIFTWGWGERGQLGRGLNTGERADDEPQRVRGADDVTFVDIAAGEQTTWGLTADGEVWGCGYGDTLGVGDVTDRHVLSPCPELRGVHIVQLSSGRYHTNFLSAQGCVYVCGRNQTLRVLGVSQPRHLFVPTRVRMLAHLHITYICTRLDHIVAVTRGGDVIEWGSLYDDVASSPRVITTLSNKQVCAVAVGDDHILALARLAPTRGANAALLPAGRREPPRVPLQSLRDLCIHELASAPFRHLRHRPALPPDLVERLLLRMNVLAPLTDRHLKLFRNCAIRHHRFPLGDTITSGWVTELCRHHPELLTLDLRNCTHVRTNAMLHVSKLPHIVQLNVDGCDFSSLVRILLRHVPTLQRVTCEHGVVLVRTEGSTHEHTSSDGASGDDSDDSDGSDGVAGGGGGDQDGRVGVRRVLADGDQRRVHFRNVGMLEVPAWVVAERGDPNVHYEYV